MRRTKTESQQTRQQLMDAALEVFWRKGVTRASLQEIAAEAGVTRGALYWHFKNKQDLFEALFEWKFGFFQQRIQSIVSGSGGDVWTQLYEALCESLRELDSDEQQRKFCHIMHAKCEQTADNQVITDLALRYCIMSRRQIEQAVQQGMEQGRLPARTDIDLATLYLESSIFGLIELWIKEPQRFRLPETARLVLAQTMRVIENGGFLR